LQRQPPTLDYRSRDTGAHRVQRVVGELTADDRFGAASVGLKLLIGVPLCLVGPLFLTVILLSFESQMRADWLPGFGVTFLLATAVLVPLLMWLERRTRGQFLSDSVKGESVPWSASSYGEYELQSAKLTWIGYIEVALTGPRLVWEAIEALRGRTPVDPPLRVAAAEIAVELFDAGEGMPLQQLVRPGRPPARVWRAVSYLARRDWVGISTRRDRIWLATPVRERLARL
jgi:hypothetical protein